MRILARLRARLRRNRPRLRCKPSVPSLHDLAMDAPALLVTNIGRAAAYQVVVSIRMRHSAFQFDELPVLEPHDQAPLLHQSKAGRFKVDAMTAAGGNWLRTVLRTVVRDTGMDLRIPLSIRYRDAVGDERTRQQTLHCDEDLRLRVTG